MPFTLEEAKQRIPEMLRRIALSSVDAVICLDKYSIDSQEFEMRIMAMQGYMNHLWKLYMIVCKTPKTVRDASRGMPKR
jgi:hypothetical protein